MTSRHPLRGPDQAPDDKRACSRCKGGAQMGPLLPPDRQVVRQIKPPMWPSGHDPKPLWGALWYMFETNSMATSGVCGNSESGLKTAAPLARVALRLDHGGGIAANPTRAARIAGP